MHFIVQMIDLPGGDPVVANSLTWLLIVAGILVLTLGYGVFVVSIKAHGMHQTRYWRVAWRSLTEKNQFPFDHMHGMLERDLRATRRLDPYTLMVLQAAKNRFSLMEETLRFRLTSFPGNPSLLVLSGLLGAIWSAWEKYSVGAAHSRSCCWQAQSACSSSDSTEPSYKIPSPTLHAAGLYSSKRLRDAQSD